jgi:hypothetical protein
MWNYYFDKSVSKNIPYSNKSQKTHSGHLQINRKEFKIINFSPWWSMEIRNKTFLLQFGKDISKSKYNNHFGKF